MAQEENQSQSIHARIAVLNLGHVGRAPITATKRDDDEPSRPALDQRSYTTSITTVSPSSNAIGNVPNGPRRDGVLPPPTITRTGQKTAQPPKPTPPPRLPPRKDSTQFSPALPPRRPSEPLSRRDSIESIASTTSNISSISALSNGTARTIASRTPSMDGGRRMAPEFDPAKLPPLPPKRTPTQQVEKGRATLKSAKSTPSVVTPPTPALPPRAPTQDFGKPPPTRRLPPRDLPTVPAGSTFSAVKKANGYNVGEPDGVDGRTPPALPNARPAPAPSMLELTPENFDEVVLRSGKAAFVDFYMPWCKYCKELDDVYPDLIASFAHAQDRLVIVKVDVASTDERKTLGSRFNIQSYPSLMWFDGESSNPEKYNSSRELKWMCQFIEEKTGIKPQAATAPKAPPPIPLSSRPDLSKLLATKPKPSSVSSQAPTTSCLICRDFSAPDTHAAKFPRHTVPSLDWLATQLTAPFPSLTDKARAIFTWLHHNIAYDTVSFFNNAVKPSTPANTLQTGLAVCEGYAGLFTALATKASLESIVVGGHGKGFGHTPLAPNSPLPPESSNHAWNAVKIDNGEWKLIDCCWGAGNISGAGKPYNKDFTPRFFTMSNHEFGLRHFPSNKMHFYGPKISWEEYILGPDPSDAQPLTIYSAIVAKEGIAESSFLPRGRNIPLSNPNSIIHFQMSRICPHWSPTLHGPGAPYVFFLKIHGLDGREDDAIPLDFKNGVWTAEVEARRLGARGQSVSLYACETVGGRSGRGLGVEGFRAAWGREAMGWQGVAMWVLV
ncbi:MAG: hypothetical protein Q9195_002811 [Heterodermia aff. obscurata]